MNEQGTSAVVSGIVSSIPDDVAREADHWRRQRRIESGRAPLADDAFVAAQRTEWDGVARLLGPPPGVQVTPVDVDGLACTWVQGPDARTDVAVMYLHAGGYVQGSVALGDHAAGRYALASGCRVLNAQYRLAPEHPYPAAVDDAIAAYRWLVAEVGSAARVVMLGESAGGGLALAALVRARAEGQPMPAAAIIVSAWADLTGTATGQGLGEDDDPALTDPELTPYAAMYAGATPAVDPGISPAHADLAGLPPLLALVGTHEVLFEDTQRIVDAARRAEVDVTLHIGVGQGHVWTTFAERDPEAQQAVDLVAAWLRTRLP
ncbi:MAG: monoterpene epsilon-lactone hydrolase [Glaciecola sp.]|jgi:monoterpene epsilon-lactone hydrolase